MQKLRKEMNKGHNLVKNAAKRIKQLEEKVMKLKVQKFELERNWAYVRKAPSNPPPPTPPTPPPTHTDKIHAFVDGIPVCLSVSGECRRRWSWK